MMIDQIEIKIIYQDNHFLVIEKPSGVIVHPWRECADKTSLIYILKKQIGKYIYPVHRLDRPVSGVMVFALSSEAANFLKGQWKSNETQKIYLGLCKGVISQSLSIDYQLWNQKKTKKQSATTFFWPIENNGYVTLTKFKIHTGRYHQIRRHCSAMGNQLIGDTKYGKGKYNFFYRHNFNLKRLFLHCSGLQINLGSGVKKFHSPLPQCLSNVVEKDGFSESFEDKIFDGEIEGLSAFSKLQHFKK